MTPPRRTRGGGSQSEYLCQKLHQHLAGSHVEVNLDGKAPDLLLRIHTATHRAFLLALHEYGIAFKDDDNDTGIPDGTLVGIEVECATDTSNLVRSILNNLSKDCAAGLS